MFLKLKAIQVDIIFPGNKNNSFSEKLVFRRKKLRNDPVSQTSFESLKVD